MAGPRWPIPPSTLGALHLTVVAGRWGLGVPEAPRGAGAGARGSTQDIMSNLELRGQGKGHGKAKGRVSGKAPPQFGSIKAGMGLGLPGGPGKGSKGRRQRGDLPESHHSPQAGETAPGPNQGHPWVPRYWRNSLNSEKRLMTPPTVAGKGHTMTWPRFRWVSSEEHHKEESRGRMWQGRL